MVFTTFLSVILTHFSPNLHNLSSSFVMAMSNTVNIRERPKGILLGGRALCGIFPYFFPYFTHFPELITKAATASTISILEKRVLHWRSRVTKRAAQARREAFRAKKGYQKATK